MSLESCLLAFKTVVVRVYVVVNIYDHNTLEFFCLVNRFLVKRKISVGC